MRIIEMLNISNTQVPVLLANGVTVYVPPRGRLVNEDVRNLDAIKKYFKIVEPLNETGHITKPDVEPTTAESAPVRRGRKSRDVRS